LPIGKIIMRIALRTSGGRGEYEVAGSHSDIKASDVFDYKICFEILPGHKIITANYIRHMQGKPRVRLQERREGDPIFKHAYQILSDALLLPKPKREIGTTPGGKLQLVDNNFSITSIQFDIIKKENFELLVNPTNIIIANSDDMTARIDIIERMRIILNTWSHSHGLFDQLSILICKHKEAFISGDEARIANAAHELRQYIGENDDPLHQILEKISLINNYTYWMGLHTTDVDEFIKDEDLTDLKEAARNRLRQWRLQARRNAEAVTFSSHVKNVYNNTCLFTGYYLPKLPTLGSSGVDSAHILPWAEYELNSVTNGICLSKLCHWAFDMGLLQLDFDERKAQYILSIPEIYLEAERKKQIDLSPFKSISGYIPKSRLPKNQQEWPNPSYLKEYNINVS
jgi:hypothetical protein